LEDSSGGRMELERREAAGEKSYTDKMVLFMLVFQAPKGERIA